MNIFETFARISESGEVDASWQKSEPVCRSELTDFIENHVVYDWYKPFFLASNYDSIQSEDIKHV